MSQQHLGDRGKRVATSFEATTQWVTGGSCLHSNGLPHKVFASQIELMPHVSESLFFYSQAPVLSQMPLNIHRLFCRMWGAFKCLF